MGGSSWSAIVRRRALLKGSTMRWFARFFHDDSAATAVEYAVMLALIIIAILGAIGAVGENAGGMWGGISGKLDSTTFGQ
jgi:pilus assembly protein Flp/PilA